MSDQDDETSSGTVVVTVISGQQRDTIKLVFDGEDDDPVVHDAEILFENQNSLKNVKNKNGNKPRGENMRALLNCDGGTLEYDDDGVRYRITVNKEPKQQEGKKRFGCGSFVCC